MKRDNGMAAGAAAARRSSHGLVRKSSRKCFRFSHGETMVEVE